MKLGQALIELIVGIGMLGILLPALATGLITSSSGKLQASNYQTATTMLKEEFESFDVVRNASWDNIATDGTYHTVVSGNTYSLVSGTESVDIFTRSLTISSVQRLNGEIVTSGGTNDPSTKKVEVIVSWDTPRPSQVSAVRYFTRYQDNLSQATSTQAEFDLGTKTSVATTNNNGGEVVLSGGGHGDWCQPVLLETLAIDLPNRGVVKSISAIPATSTLPGFIYTGTGDNASGVTFAKVSVTDTEIPVINIIGSLNGDKTNGVFGETNYAYITTDTNSKELVILNISSLPYSESGYFNAPGNGDGSSVYVSGNYGFMTVGNKFYAFDLSSKSGSRPQVGSAIDLAGTGNKIQIVGDYAFVAIESSSTQMQIINVSNPTSLSNSSKIGQAINLNNQGAKDLFVNATGTLLYLVTSNSITSSELFVIDIGTKTGNRPTLASVDTGSMSPTGVVAVTNNKVIAVGIGGVEYQVFNYNNSNHTFNSCSAGLNIDVGVNGVASVVQPSGSAYSYIISGTSNNNKLNLIEGGPTGQSAFSGTYTSAVFDAGHSTAFNLISWTADNVNPPTTNIQFQVAVADPNPDCASASYSFVGPDGTSGTYFIAPGAFPLNDNGGNYQNPGQCFKYQAVFTTLDISQSPILNDVTWGYSP